MATGWSATSPSSPDGYSPTATCSAGRWICSCWPMDPCWCRTIIAAPFTGSAIASKSMPERSAMRSFGAVLLAIGRGFDLVRKFLHLLLLLIIFGFVLGVWRVSVPIVPARAALHVAPEGEIVDQLSGDPIERAIAQAQGLERAETLLWDLTDAIRGAAKDKRIAVMVLHLDYMSGAGQATL